MEKRRFSKGECICRERDEGSEMYVILSGSVIPHKTVNGQKIELSAVGAGEFFGEMCLFSRKTRSATVVAAGDCEVLVLDKDSLLEKLQGDPRVGVKIIEMLIRRLEAAHDVIEELKGAQVSFEMMYGRSDRAARDARPGALPGRRFLLYCRKLCTRRPASCVACSSVSSSLPCSPRCTRSATTCSTRSTTRCGGRAR